MRQSNDSTETRAERFEALRDEQRITEEEYELLCDAFLEEDVFVDVRNWLSSETIEDLSSMLKVGIEGGDPYTDSPSSSDIEINIAALPAGAEVALGCHAGYAPTAIMLFTAQEHEQQFRKVVSENAPYEIEVDFADDAQAPQMGVSFNVIPSGYDGDISKEEILIEINHLFSMISTTYRLSPSKLFAGSISVKRIE